MSVILNSVNALERYYHSMYNKKKRRNLVVSITFLYKHKIIKQRNVLVIESHSNDDTNRI